MIILIGPLPPPTHGASVVTERVMKILASTKHSATVCSTSPRPNARRLAYHFSRIRAYLNGGLIILRRGRQAHTTVYLSVSGGLGLFYDLVITFIARIKNLDIIFHHHSFAYITERSRIMSAIIGVAGRKQVHIALCPRMAESLAKLYGAALPIEIVSNLAFFDALDAIAYRKRQRLQAIGFLSNISFEKGIDRFLDLMAQLRGRGSTVLGRIAGPFDNNEIRQYVEKRIEEIGRLEYVGAVYGAEKTSFLSSIDLFVLPTRYANEAQPLVVYEAQCEGVVVAASDRGCLADMLPSELLIDPTGSNVEMLIEKILSWESDSTLFRFAAQRAQDRFAELIRVQKADTIRFARLISSNLGPQ